SDDFIAFFFFFSSRRRHTRFKCDWSSDVCSSDLTFRRSASFNPLIKRGLKLAERRNVLAQFFGGKGSWQRLRFFESSRLAKDARSEERRVGKEWRTGWWRGNEKEK